MHGPLSLHDLRVGLFVPATRPGFIARAHERGADAIVLDLEDGVAPDRKDEARQQLAGAVARLIGHGVAVLVRVNAQAALFGPDVEAALAAGVRHLVLPKQDSVDTVRAAAAAIDAAEARTGRPRGHARLLLLVESPRAVMAAAALAGAHERTEALLFGSEDYCASLGLSSETAALDWPAQQVAVAARAAGLAALGLPGSIARLRDPAAFDALAARARAMGFTGCLCVHPDQVGPLRHGFGPTVAELARARAIVEAAAAPSLGAVQVDGRMVDAPLVAQARRLLDSAGQDGKDPPSA